ncbi:MAG: TIGR04190 family B12-binding domain/radical SAM domain protein [archaeon]|nr:TIGR04190 family B12-binding domain/radical SAM domain protein [archaeon]
MSKVDIAFIHAPTVYDFRKKSIFYGPVSDVVPSSPVFEMYPIGFMTISTHLEAAGFKTRIVNLAVKMLQSKNFNAEKYIEKLEAKVYAIDLHWMPHCHGAIEVAKLVKKHHPNSIVEIGGFSSSYFYKELIVTPWIDMVMCGDSTEIPHVKMMQDLDKGQNFSAVPNLVWKDSEGHIHVNKMSFIPENLDWLQFDYGTMIKCTIRNMDISGAIPWLNWDKLPLTSVFTVRGCSHNCAECGGSHDASRKFLFRQKPAFRSPEDLADDVISAQNYLNAPTFVIGDLRQGGRDYAERFFKSVKNNLRNHIAMEIFQPAGNEFFRMANHYLDGNYSMEFSPDSHDEIVRFAMGKMYDNASIEKTITTAFSNGCKRFDLFYMTGLPLQTKESAMNSVKTAGKLWNIVKKSDNLYIYSAPLAPFIDPGSRIFENPEKWGYKFFARTLEDHRNLLDNPSWKYTLSYETKWMTRDDIVDVSYNAALELTKIALQTERVDQETYKTRIDRTNTARNIMVKIDNILKYKDEGTRNLKLQEVKEDGEKMMMSTVCNKKDLDWDTRSIWRNAPHVAIGLFKSILSHSK